MASFRLAARGASQPQKYTTSALCAQCNMPLDAKGFDAFGIFPAPEAGSRIVLAHFDLPPQYCGLLEYFSQFTNAFASDPSNVETPGLEWTLLVNSRPLHPYLQMQHILNPWGFGSFQTAIRLDEGVRLEFVIRRLATRPAGAAESTPPVTRVGGRIVGRYWYNAAYGDLANGRG